MKADPRSSFLGGASAFVALPLVLCVAACNNGGGGGGGDTTAPTVSASPPTTVFMTANVAVTLSASDNKDASPTIHYTTDASPPTTMSPVYTGALTFTENTVLKYFAVDDAGNASDVAVAGYTRAANTIELEWANSGHGEFLGEPFRHWDADGTVSKSCAKCHAGEGFVDFIEDGTTNSAAALPLGHYCFTCHSSPPTTRYEDLVAHPELEPVRFPSGRTASLWGSSNLCITCHQGRSSSVQVDAAITANPGGPYSFINIHYYAAAASFFGAETAGGYHYESEEYFGRNSFPSHETGQKTCVGCHMRTDFGSPDHTFVPQVSDCNSCHTGATFETLSGSPSRNHTAIQTSSAELLEALQDYANDVIGIGIVYDPNSHPYFFKDTNDNGLTEPEEVTSSNRYTDLDETMLKAAYNYQVVAKDPAGYIHNGTYLRQILHDSIVDLGGTPSVPAPGRPGFDADGATKAEQWHLSGHSDSLGEPFRHWDEEATAEIPASCARCHSTPGFVDFAADGVVAAAAPLGTTVECFACHGNADLFSDPSTRYDDLVQNTALEPVTFPSGLTASLGTSNICMTCHQGRESGLSIDATSPNTAVQTPSDYDSFDFINRHYYAAGAILFGSDVKASYEYTGPTYRGQTPYPIAHVDRTTCVGCHMRGDADHTFLPQLDDCTTCHLNLTSFEELGRAFGVANVDYDGDGMGESFQHEIDGQKENLLAAIQTYAAGGLPFMHNSPVIYVPGTYPYWFKDSDGNGQLTEGENSFANRYRDFDRRLLRAAFNFHSAQDPCGDMHNYQYVLQTLFDSIDDLDDGVLNGSAPGTRP